ncbi:hypothetical protein OZZ08_13775 [Malaciobacter mytili]|uniref:hypothetical protein n=1 Tax=Malaciobacter mytili TaxID=603050 RepID=UPI003BB12E34
MKKILIISLLSSNILFSSSLEDSILNQDLSKLEQPKTKKYLVVREEEKNVTIEDGKIEAEKIEGLINGMNFIRNNISQANMFYKKEYENKVKNIKSNEPQIIVLKYLELKKIYKRKINEFISIKFRINDNNELSELNIIEKSNYNEINEAFIEAINKAKYELQKNQNIEINYQVIL